MADLLANAATWLAARRDAYSASTVTYQRGAQSIELSATRGQTEYESSDVEGFVAAGHVVDFIVTTSGFTFGRPKIGDRISDGSAVFEVAALGTEECWRWSDRFEKSMRIHTKRVE